MSLILNSWRADGKYLRHKPPKEPGGNGTPSCYKFNYDYKLFSAREDQEIMNVTLLHCAYEKKKKKVHMCVTLTSINKGEIPRICGANVFWEI